MAGLYLVALDPHGYALVGHGVVIAPGPDDGSYLVEPDAPGCAGSQHIAVELRVLAVGHDAVGLGDGELPRGTCD